jgi:hypothetical protein
MRVLIFQRERSKLAVERMRMLEQRLGGVTVGCFVAVDDRQYLIPGLMLVARTICSWTYDFQVGGGVDDDVPFRSTSLSRNQLSKACSIALAFLITSQGRPSEAEADPDADSIRS